ncbi:MAG: cytochrome C biogenesis protein, partial [Symploca sp. SIO1C2]|nr:cytochrome C biogenesis protein [Symploca sp. SIO1C2]
MKPLKFIIGLCLGILILAIPFSQFQPSPVESLQTLAVQLDGRKKPLDTVARETVAQIHGRLRYQTNDGNQLDYLSTYLSLWFNDRDWNEEPFILFSYRPLKERVGLESGRKYFTFAELITSDLGSVVLSARQKQANEQDLSRDEREALTIEERLGLMLDTVGQNSLPLVPHPSQPKGTWVSIPETGQYYQPEVEQTLASNYDNLKSHFDSISILGQTGQQLQTELRQLSPQIYPSVKNLEREVNFYKLHPFGKAWILYAIAFCVMLIVLLFPTFDFYWGAIGIFTSGLLIQGYGFIERMQIAGRPPVTNMYESVIWVGFGVAAIA